MKSFAFIAILSMLLFGCNAGPQPIAYGTDACHFCNMTIVDRQHAAQVVTTKGRAYKYDAIECMVHSLQDEFRDTEMKFYLTANFDRPGEMMDAHSATFLVSDEIPSPMGANLSAFENEAQAQKAQDKFTGKLFTWEEIQKHLKHE